MIEINEVFIFEDFEAILSLEELRKLKLKKGAIYMVKGQINSIEEIDKEYVVKAFTPKRSELVGGKHNEIRNKL